MLGRRTALILGNTVVGAVLGFAALKVFAVSTGPAAEGLLGQLGFAMGLAGLLSIFLDLGFTAAHVRRISEGGDAADATATFAVIKGALALAVLGLLGAAFLVARQLGLLGIAADVPPAAVGLVLLFWVFVGLRSIFTATFDGREQFAKSQAVVLTENAVRSPLMMLVGLAYGAAVFGAGPLVGIAGPGSDLGAWVASRGAHLLAAAYAVAGAASLLVAVAFFRRSFAWGRPDRALATQYWGYARHVFVMLAVGTIYVSLDKVVVGFFWEPANTGRYFGAQRFTDLISMVPIAVYTVLFPALSGRHARGDKAQVRAGIEAALRHVSLIVVPLAAYTLAMAAPLLSLVLTGEFGGAVPTLRVLSLYALAFALIYPYSTLLQALGRPDLTARAAVVALTLNAALNLLFVPASLGGIPTLGLQEVGAALATTLAATVQLGMMRREVHRLEGHVPFARHTGRHLVAGAAMVGVLLTLAPTAFGAVGAPDCTPHDCPQGAPGLLLLALAALGGLVYLGVLAALREFRRHDLDLYLHILDPAAMARYVREEVRELEPGLRGDGPGRGPR